MIASCLATRQATSSLGVADAPLIATSARKLGVHDDDMIHAFNDPSSSMITTTASVMFVGADTSGNLLEIGVIESVDGPIIIHA